MVFVPPEIIVLFHLLMEMYHKFPLSGLANGPAGLHSRSRHPSSTCRGRSGSHANCHIRIISVLVHVSGQITYRI